MRGDVEGIVVQEDFEFIVFRAPMVVEVDVSESRAMGRDDTDGVDHELSRSDKRQDGTAAFERSC